MNSGGIMAEVSPELKPRDRRVLHKYHSFEENSNGSDEPTSQFKQKHRQSFNGIGKLTSAETKKNLYNSIVSKVTTAPNHQNGNGHGVPVPSLTVTGDLGPPSNGNGSCSDTQIENHQNGIPSPEGQGSSSILAQGLVAVAVPVPSTGSSSSVHDRHSLKHLSASAPAIRAQGMVTMRTSEEISAANSTELILAPSSSKSRQKKFHRHFKTVSQEEKVLDYYSCALVGDILLQGYLYITENHFAFYSNVFGYVTKLLIPVSSVVRITKERTAKIIPNAVAVWTMNEKHVFASLISRETTYKLMFKIWNHSIDRDKIGVLKLKTQLIDEDKGSGDLSVPDESSGESGSGNDSAVEPPSPPILDKIPHVLKAPVVVGPSISPAPLQGIPYQRSIHSLSHRTTSVQGTGMPMMLGQSAATKPNSGTSYSFPRGPSLQLLATALLVILFLSAAMLLSRISTLQEKLTASKPYPGILHDSEQLYQNLLSFQNKLHSGAADEIHQYIDVNLEQIRRIRQSLEALSLLFMTADVESESKIGLGGTRDSFGSDSGPTPKPPDKLRSEL